MPGDSDIDVSLAVLRQRAEEAVERAAQLIARQRELIEARPKRAGNGDSKHRAIVEELTSEVRNLRRALESRAVIEQAKGILISQSRCSEDEAFELLRKASQRSNRKLHDIAVELVTRHQQKPTGT